MVTALKKDIKQTIEQATSYCSQQELEIVFTYEISDDLLDKISKRSNSFSSMYFASKDMFKERLKNGCYLLIKGNDIYGHIFAHRHLIHKHSVYERCSLWVHPDYQNHNIGLLLMHLLTERYHKDFLISIAQEPSVHHNNELLGMKHITLSKISSVLIETLEQIGKLRDEYKYKYYVNPYFELKIKQFNKVLSNVNKT